LPLPKTIFQLAKRPSATFTASLLEKLGKFELEKLDIGKGNPVYTMAKPIPDVIEKFLPQFCQAQGPVVNGVAQLVASKAMCTIYRCIEAFLRTHTYDFKNSPGEKAAKTKDSIGERMELRNDENWYREGLDEKKQKLMEKGKYVAGKIDDHEDEDLTPTMPFAVNPVQSVLVAKPSPMPSTMCWGSPSSVPAKKGIFFPYFQGLIVPDAASLRIFVTSLFFRNIGKEGQDLKQAYKEWRSEIGTFATTEEGTQMQHILFGLILALEAQAICYLIFDDGVYRGYCLLGEYFSVFAHGKWWEPEEVETLRAELSRVKTRKVLIEELIQSIGKARDESGDAIIVEAEGKNLVDIARYLEQIDVTETEDEVLKEIQRGIADCSFPTNFLTFKPKHIAEAVKHLANPESPGFTSDIPFYVPLKGWSRIASREYQILASFGPRAPSFRNAKGTDIRIPRNIHASDPLETGKDEKPFYVIEKPVLEAVRDWDEVIKTGVLRFDFDERAGGNRTYKFLKAEKALIWDEFKEAGVKDMFGQAGPAGGTKRQYDEAFGKGDFDAELPDI
jgi:hypothetical protein